ncbi:MAG: Gfo/Idh/MocA family oxidoreductase, partial [Alphaproteobacteria bacterium]|nr:Gfo/Idh/MocA family oxidoreductase [Alphaproteobacteria bacterium]
MKQTDIQSQPAVVLMGLGRVGTAAPAVYGPRDRLVIRNHADAILAAGGRLAALVDSSEQRRESAMKKLAVRGGAEVEQVAKISQLRPGCADIVTIATPPQGRLELLSEALDLGPKAVILEKPLTVDLDEAAALLQIAAKARIPLYVCFNRRTDPGMREFTKAVDFTKV